MNTFGNPLTLTYRSLFIYKIILGDNNPDTGGNKEHLEYAQKCMNKFFEVSAQMPDAILAIRDELDLEISPDEYLEIYNENNEKGKRIFSKFIQQVPNA